MTVAALRARHGWDEGAVEIVVVQTSGDRIQDRALADIGGKALWTKELDRALASGEIDFAVHSMKDVETRSEEHTSELQSLMRLSYAVFCLKKKNTIRTK